MATTYDRPITARREGTCPACHESIEQGDSIIRGTHIRGYVHYDCRGLVPDAEPAREERDEVSVTEPGVYEKDGVVYVVKPNRAKDRLYAKRIVEIGGTRMTDAGTFVEIEYEYAPGVVYELSPEDRMTGARAKELTLRYGRCVVCGRFLKVAESVETGIGPVCAQAFPELVAERAAVKARARAEIKAKKEEDERGREGQVRTMRRDDLEREAGADMPGLLRRGAARPDGSGEPGVGELLLDGSGRGAGSSAATVSARDLRALSASSGAGSAPSGRGSDEQRAGERLPSLPVLPHDRGRASSGTSRSEARGDLAPIAGGSEDATPSLLDLAARIETATPEPAPEPRDLPGYVGLSIDDEAREARELIVLALQEVVQEREGFER